MTDIATRSEDGIVVVKIDRKSRANALRPATIHAIRATIADAERSAAHGLVLTGSANRFSSGADLDALNGTIDDLGFDDDLEELTGAIQASSLVIVAAVEGICFGAAIDLAWSCDAVVLGRNARVALPASKLGILYNPVSLARLHHRVGSSVLRRLVVLGEEVPADTIGSAGAAVIVKPGSAIDSALNMVRRSRGVETATKAAKATIADLDAGALDPKQWQGVREELLSAPTRSEALRARKGALKGSND